MDDGRALNQPQQGLQGAIKKTRKTNKERQALRLGVTIIGGHQQHLSLSLTILTKDDTSQLRNLSFYPMLQAGPFSISLSLLETKGNIHAA
jgi:hypothetical protein